METLAEHFIAYYHSWRGIIGFCAILLLVWAARRTQSTRLSKQKLPIEQTIPGCRLYGMYKTSNLKDQYDARTDEENKPQVKAIFAYPIKSCKGIELPAAEITRTGLKYDRIFSFAQLVSTPVKADARSKDTSQGFEDVSAEWKHEWRFITQREFPKLALVDTKLYLPDPTSQSERRDSSAAQKIALESGDTDAGMVDSWVASGGCLVASLPYVTEGKWNKAPRNETVSFSLPLKPTSQRATSFKYRKENMTIWRDSPRSINVTSEIDANVLEQLAHFLGVSNTLGIFREDDSNLRIITRSLPKDHRSEKYQVGFADAFPVHLLNLASARAVDVDMPEKANFKHRLDIRRFRANIIVSGVPAYAEDKWKRIKLSEYGAQYHAACRTARCNLPNVDQETGLRDRNEPGMTLRRTRQVDSGAKPHPCLGLSMIPLFDHAERTAWGRHRSRKGSVEAMESEEPLHSILQVGDLIEVLETGEHVYEKMFA